MCDEFSKAIHYRDDPQVRKSSAEIMTEPLVAAAFHGATTNKTCSFLSEYVYIEKTISKSRLNRRLHAIEE